MFCNLYNLTFFALNYEIKFLRWKQSFCRNLKALSLNTCVFEAPCLVSQNEISATGIVWIFETQWFSYVGFFGYKTHKRFSTQVPPKLH